MTAAQLKDAIEETQSSWAIPVNPTEVVALMLTEDLLAPVEGSWLAEPLANLRSRLSSTLTPTGRAVRERCGAGEGHQGKFFLRECHAMAAFADSKTAGTLSRDMLSLGGCFFFGARMA